MIVRPATPADAGPLAALRAASWSAAYPQILPADILRATTTDPNMARFYAEAISEAPGSGRAFFVADEDGRIAGYSSAGPARERDLDPSATGELYALYTAPDAWGTATGRALQQKALSFLARRDFPEAVVRVFTANARARRFYAKTGWTFDGDEQVSRRWLIPEVRYRRALPRIRPPGAEDAARVAEVHVRAWQDAYQGQMPQDYLDGLGEQIERRTAWWAQMIEQDGAAHTLVVETEGAITGIASAGPSRDDGAEAGTGEVLMINLVAAAWGTGEGQALFDASVDLLVREGFKEATLWVLETNARARRFYERNGWFADGAVRDDEVRGFALREVRYRRLLPSGPAVID